MMTVPILTWLPPEIMTQIMEISLAPFPAPKSHEDVMYLGGVMEVVGAKMLEKLLTEHRRHSNGC